MPDDRLSALAMRQRIVSEAAIRVLNPGQKPLIAVFPTNWSPESVSDFWSGFDLDWLHDPLVFTGANPRTQGEQLLVGPIEARDREGRVRLTVEGGVCRKLGEIHDDF